MRLNNLELTHFSSETKLPMRFYLTNHCNYRCRTPLSTEFCDHQYTDAYPSINDLTLIFKLFQKTNLTEIAKISGREPTLYPDLIPLVKELNKTANKITLSTNGYLNHEVIFKAIKSGVSLITLPIPSLDPKKYGFFTGLPEKLKESALKNILELINQLTEYNVELHFIRILIKDFNDSSKDMKDFISFSKKNKAITKIFDLNYHHRLNILISDNIFSENLVLQDSIENIWQKLYVSTTNWKKKFLSEAVKKIEFSNKISCRKVILMSMKNGAKILMDEFLPEKKKEITFCNNCMHFDYCREGPFSNGWELRPDLLIQACPLREDITINLKQPENIRNIKKTNGDIIVER